MKPGAMEIPEETDGPGLLELQRFAAASLAFLTSSTLESGHDEVFGSCEETQEDIPVAEALHFLESSCGGAEESFSHLLRRAKAFQFFFALQEAQQRVEEVEHARDGTATSSRATELEKKARGAVAAAIQMYLLHSVDGAPLGTKQRTTAADASCPDVKATAGVEESGISTIPAAAGADGGVPELFQEEVALVSDTEIEAWKWEGLGVDSEAPTDTEGQGSIRTGNLTGTNETCKRERSRVEKGSSTPEHNTVIAERTASSGKRRETAAGQRAETAEAGETGVDTSASGSNVPFKTEAHSVRAEAELVSYQVATSGASKISLVDEKHGVAVLALAQLQSSERRTEEHATCVTGRPSEVVRRFRAEAGERQSLFSLSAGGVRRRRGRREQKVNGGRSVLGSASREPAIEKDADEDVTGQLLGLAQEMKVEATRYGEVLQRDNERLQRTGEAQQQYMDDTDASTRQTRSLIRGTGFGFLYAMVLLAIACALFVAMLAFILFVRG